MVSPVDVAEHDLRRRFAAGDYLNRAMNGEFGCCLKAEGRPTSPDEPAGTRSIMVSYVNELRHRIIMVHIYLRPDGSIGASGQPDPKWLFEDGVVYQATKGPAR